MSVIVKTPQGQIKLYCKGADTVSYSLYRCSNVSVCHNQPLHHLPPCFYAYIGMRRRSLLLYEISCICSVPISLSLHLNFTPYYFRYSFTWQKLMPVFDSLYLSISVSLHKHVFLPLYKPVLWKNVSLCYNLFFIYISPSSYVSFLFCLYIHNSTQQNCFPSLIICLCPTVGALEFTSLLSLSSGDLWAPWWQSAVQGCHCEAPWGLCCRGVEDLVLCRGWHLPGVLWGLFCRLSFPVISQQK